MKKLFFTIIIVLLSWTIRGQNCATPGNVNATASSHSSVTVSWDLSNPQGRRNIPRMELWNQADLVNQPGAGANGADVSSLYGGGETFGNTATYPGWFVADDFSLTGKSHITEMEFYAYQTNAGIDTSTITGVYVEIYDRQPTDLSLRPIWNGNGQNLIKSSSWTGIYRTNASSSTYTSTDRPIMQVIAQIDTTLPAGEYWVAVSFTGNPELTGPWAVPRVNPEETSTGNGMQFNPNNDYQRWIAWQMGTNEEQMGMPFIIRGFNVSDSLAGFNIYRDNVLLTSEPVGRFEYKDEGLSAETGYCYAIEALYVNGCTSGLSQPVCATTPQNPCMIINIPYSESFDTYRTGSGTFPRCWDYARQNTTNTPYITTTNFSAPGSLYFTGGTNYSTVVIAPPVDPSIPLHNLQVNFQLRKSTSSSELLVGVITDINHPVDSFILVQRVSPANTTSWQEFTVEFSGYTGPANYIGFKTSGGLFYLDNVVIDYIPTCPSPDSLLMGDLTGDNTVTFQWTPRGNETSWILEYKAQGDEEWTGSGLLSSPQFTLTDLEDGSVYHYTVRVKAVCGPDDESYWLEDAFNFSTLCKSALEVPYLQNFDDYTGTNYNVAGTTPICWSSFTNNSTYPAPHIVTGTSYAYRKSEPNAFGFTTGTSGAGPKATAILPKFTTPINDLYIEFWTRMESVTYGTLYLGYVTEEDNDSTFVSLFTIPTNTTGQIHKIYFMASTQNIPDDAQIAFQWFNSTGSYYSCTLDDILIDLVPSCITPSSFLVENIGTENAGFSWQPVGDESSWEIAYKTVDEEEWSTETVFTDTTTTLLNLFPGTNYQVKIRAICNDTDQSEWSTEILFMTDCILTEIPYSENFDTYGTGSTAYLPCWKRINTIPTANNVYISTTNFSAPGALYIYSTTTSRSYAIMPALTPEIPVKSLQASFMLRTTTAAANLTVGVMSDPANDTTFFPIKTVKPSATGTWEMFDVSLENYPDTLHGSYIAFKSGDSTVYSTVYLDDLTIYPIPNCSRIDSISIDMAQAPSVTISWDTESSATYLLKIKENNEDSWTYYENATSPHTINDLQTNGNYSIRIVTLCDDNALESRVFSFNNVCSPIVTLPYLESFDSYGTGTGTYPTCWTRYYSSATSTYPYITSTNYSSPGSLYIYSGSGYYVMAVSPEIGSDIDLHELTISFKARNTTLSNRLQVGMIKDPQDPATFDSITTIRPSQTSTWQDFSIDLRNYNGIGRYVALKGVNVGNSTSNTIYVDDFKIDRTPTCFAPDTLLVIDLKIDEATIVWNNNNSSDWELAYRISGADLWTIESNITTNQYTLTSLETNTPYEFKVKANCAGNGSDWSEKEYFTTLCPQFDIPYTENFDNYGTGTSVFVPCWYKYVSDNAASIYINATNYSTPGSLYLSTTSTTYAVASLPELAVPLNELQMTFQLRNSTANNNITVGIMTDPYDINSFEPFITLTTNATSTWEEKTVYFDRYEGTGKFIAFKSDSRHENRSNTIYIDNLHINYLPECVPPVDIVISGINSESAIISWKGIDMGGWELFLDVEGTDLDTIQPIQINENPYTITGLDPSTGYVFKLRTACNGSDPSIYSDQITFRTSCPPLMDIPFIDKFDHYGTGTAAYPDCWLSNTDYSSDMYVTNNYFSSPGALYLYTGANTYKIAATQEIDAPLNQLQVSFIMKASSLAYNLYIGIMEDPADESTFELIETVRPKTTSWNSFTIPLTTYTGNGKHIAVKTGSDVSNTFYLDNFKIDYAPSCVFPINLSVEDIGTTHAKLTWPSSDNTTWAVAYGPTGFNPNVDVNPTVVSQNYLEVSGLAPATHYDFYVKSYCGGGTESSEWSLVCTFLTLCGDIETLPYMENFDGYGTGSTIFPLCWTRYYTSTTAYPYITTTNYSTPGSLYFYANAPYIVMASSPRISENINMDTLRVKFKLRKLTSSYNLHVGVSDDPNDPTTFELIKTVTPSATSTWESIAVNLLDYAGDKRYISLMAGDESYSSTVYVDDFIIEYWTPCTAPESFQVINTTDTNATLSWNSDDDNWSIEYRKTGNATWTSIPSITENPYELNGLDDNSEYEIRIRTNCIDNVDESDWSETITFKTPCSIYPAPFYEGFDGTAFAPDCWGLYKGKVSDVFNGIPWEETLSGWGRNTVNNGLTTPHATLNLQGTECYYWLTTPEIHADLTEPTLYFNVALTDHGNTNPPVSQNNADDVFMVIISDMANPADTISRTWNNTGSGGFVMNDIPNTGQRFEIPLDRFRGKNIQIAFYGESLTANADNDLHIDSVRVIEKIRPCNAPTNLQVTTYPESALVSWTTEDNATGWILEYKTGNQPWTRINCTNNCSETSYQITSLTPETNYQVHIKAICTSGQSEWSEIKEFTTNTIGIHENDLSSSLTIFPNPAFRYIEYEITDNNFKLESISVYDIYGKEIKVIADPDQNRKRINIEGLAPGIYLLHFQSEEGIVTKKFVKQ